MSVFIYMYVCFRLTMAQTISSTRTEIEGREKGLPMRRT